MEIWGGAINGSIITVNNSKFYNNSAIVGGAIFGLAVTISNSIFVSNYAGVSGGAIHNEGITGIIDSIFTYNSSSMDGGAIWNSWILNIRGSIFANNMTWGVGSAIYNRPGELSINDSRFIDNDCVGAIVDNGGNLVNNAPGCPGVYSDFAELPIATPPPPPQCQEMIDPGFSAPVGTYCQTLMRDGQDIGYAGAIPVELVNAGVIIAMEVVHYDLSGQAMQHFAEDGNQQVCLQGEGRFIYLDATQAPRQIVEMNSVYEGGYTCAWIPNPGTVVLIES